MVSPIVASAVAGAGIKTVLDKTVFKKNDGNHRADGDDLCCAFPVASDMNINHDADAVKSRYLAQPYPNVDERDVKTPDNWVKRHPNFDTIDRETPV